MPVKSKMLGNREIYESEVVSLVDEVDLIIKKFSQLEKQSKQLLHLRNMKIGKAGEMLGVYGGEMATQSAGQYMASAGKALERIANKYLEADAALMAGFSCRLTSWLAEHQKNVEMQIKFMEDMRKEMLKAGKKGEKNPDQFATGAEAAKASWGKTCADTVEVMKKFISEANEFKKFSAAWIQKEKALNSYNKDQCAAVASGRKGRPLPSKEAIKTNREENGGDGSDGEGGNEE